MHAASLTTDVAEQVNETPQLLVFNLSAGDGTLSAGGFVHVHTGSSLAMYGVAMVGSQAGVGGAFVSTARTGGLSQLCLARMAVIGTIVAGQGNGNPSNETAWSSDCIVRAHDNVLLFISTIAGKGRMRRRALSAQCCVRTAAHWLSTLDIALHCATHAIVRMLGLNAIAGNAAPGDSRYCSSAFVLKLCVFLCWRTSRFPWKGPPGTTCPQQPKTSFLVA